MMRLFLYVNIFFYASLIVRAQYTQIWYYSMVTAPGDGRWADDSSSCPREPQSCAKTVGDPSGWIQKSTNIAAYSQVQFQLDLIANYGGSTSICQIWYAFDGGTLIKQGNYPSAAGDGRYYNDLIINFPASPTATSITIRIGITSNDSADKCYLNDFYLRGIPKTSDPTKKPTSDPTPSPTSDPTPSPTSNPSTNPSLHPTKTPTRDPSKDPTTIPSIYPTNDPTRQPIEDMTIHPTNRATGDPNFVPTIDQDAEVVVTIRTTSVMNYITSENDEDMTIIYIVILLISCCLAVCIVSIIYCRIKKKRYVKDIEMVHSETADKESTINHIIGEQDNNESIDEGKRGRNSGNSHDEQMYANPTDNKTTLGNGVDVDSNVDGEDIEDMFESSQSEPETLCTPHETTRSNDTDFGQV